MPTFIGLDLAWTAHRESGICWFEGESAADLRCTRLEAAVCNPRRLADELAAVEGPLVVTIDAPLLYTPERWAEREVARRFGRYKASAHSAHAAVRRGYTAGIDLGRALMERGFTTDPAPLLRGAPGRFAVEIYPHTVHVRLFGLSERLPYKPKGGRSVAFRREVMRRVPGPPGNSPRTGGAARPRPPRGAARARPVDGGEREGRWPEASRRHPRRPDLCTVRLAPVEGARSLGDAWRPERLHRRAPRDVAPARPATSAPEPSSPSGRVRAPARSSPPAPAAAARP